jgi:hypothetical protein
METWSGLPRLKPVFEELRPRLRTFVDERGRELFDLPDAPRPGARTPVPARFLPEFDNLMPAHADRSRVIADEHRPKVATKNLRIKATFLWNGVAAGTWTSERKKDRAVLRLEPFAPLPKAAVKELTKEGEALLGFLEPDAPDLEVKS